MRTGQSRPWETNYKLPADILL